MFSKFSEEAQKVLLLAKKEMFDLKHPYIGSEHLFLAVLHSDNDVREKLEEYGVDYKAFRKEIIRVIGIGTEENDWYLYTPLLKRIIENAVVISKEMNMSEIGVYQLVLSILEEGDGVAIRILNNLDVDVDELYDDLTEKGYDKKKSKKKLQIEEFGYDLNKLVLDHKVDPVVERDSEISRMIEILSRRSKNNPLLVGEAGVGKTAVVEELARRIVKGDVPARLKNKRIISIEIANLVAGTKYRGEFEERMSKIIKEVEENEDIIVFIDEVHTLIGAGGAEGAIDASNILKPALSRGKIKMIGATTCEEYKKTIEKDKAFDRRFQKVDIEEPDTIKTFKILSSLRTMYESFHGVMVSDEILKDIVSLSNRYLYERKQPDKAIDILDEVCAKCSLNAKKYHEKMKECANSLNEVRNQKLVSIQDGDYVKAAMMKEKESQIEKYLTKMNERVENPKSVAVVTLKDVKEVIYNCSKIPIYDFENREVQLKRLEKTLKTKVLGQDKVINALLEETKRIQYGFKKSMRPSSFLFVGPTGVGKTLLAKEYSKMLFGEDKIIRFDMSEYREDHTISKIIGSPSGYVGYDDGKNKLEEIRKYPYSVILLDEIEKASPAVLNLFLQILDEGKVTDSAGRVIRFDHNIIIMTSNVGFSKKNIGFVDDAASILSNLKEIFSIEFINRIGRILIFDDLIEDTVSKIIKEKISGMKKELKNKGITVSIKNTIIKEIMEEAKYQEFGARQIDKLIEEKVDPIIIDSMLDGKKNISIKTLTN